MTRARAARRARHAPVRAAVVALVVVAMAASGCGGGADAPDVPDTGFDLAAPPAGYVACVVNTRSGLEITNVDDSSLHVYGDERLDDPYAGPTYGLATFDSVAVADLDLPGAAPVEIGEVRGVASDMSGFLLAQLPAEAGVVLTWSLDGRTVQLGGRGFTVAELIPVAARVQLIDRRAVVPLDALPEGYTDLGDINQLEGQTRFLYSIDYELPSDEPPRVEDQLTVLVAEGGPEALEAFRFRAVTSARVTVQGRPGVVGDVGDDGTGPFVVAWLPTDDLLVRIFAFEQDTEALQALAEDVQRLEGDAWQARLERAPDPRCI